MTLVEEIKKLRDGGYVGVDKHMVKVCESILFYAETFDMKINYARLQYDQEFDLNCRQAEEAKQDLWVYLSNKFKIPEEERYLIEPPDKLKNKKKRQDCIKWRFWPFFYEWKLNNFANPITYAFSKGVVSYRKRGENTVKITKLRSAARKAPIIKERKRLIDAGIKDEKVIRKLVVKAFPDEHYHYIRQTILVEKHKEADERRLQKPFAL